MLVHFADLRRALGLQLKRLAAFIRADPTDDAWDRILHHCSSITCDRTPNLWRRWAGRSSKVGLEHSFDQARRSNGLVCSMTTIGDFAPNSPRRPFPKIALSGCLIYLKHRF